MYCLGRDLLLRMPRRCGPAESLAREVRTLPTVAALVPVPVPQVRLVGGAAAGYPHLWAVYGWLRGSDAWGARGQVADPNGDRLAADLARVVRALRAAPPVHAPARERGDRGGPFDAVLAGLDAWVEGVHGPVPPEVDVGRVREVARASSGAGDVPPPPVLSHGDLLPGNLLLHGDRLAAVIDWGGLGYADPAQDLTPAWAVLGPRARRVFRSEVGADDATWARGRVTALEQAVAAVVYHGPRGHPLADVGRRTVEQALADR